MVIFGAGAPGASVKSAIDRSNEKNFIVRAFIDQRSQYHRKRLDGIVVIAPNQFEELHRKYKIENAVPNIGNQKSSSLLNIRALFTPVGSGA